MVHEQMAVVVNNQTPLIEKAEGVKMLKWNNGKNITTEQLQQLTGLTIKRQAMVVRLKRAKERGVPVSTLPEQLAVLLQAEPTPVSEGGEIPLTSDVNEARRLKTIREALLLDEKRKQAEIETRLKRRQVFYLEAIEPAWSAMVVSIREALRGMIPHLVDKVMPLSDRNEAVSRAEDEMARHLTRLASFDLVRELNESEGIEQWQFTNETDWE